MVFFNAPAHFSKPFPDDGENEYIESGRTGKSKMPITEAPSPASSPDRKGVRKMLILFAVLGVVGVFLLAVSVLLGIIVLVVAEAFFVMAYRSFSKRSPSVR